MLNRVLASAIRTDETGARPDIVLSNLSTNQYFSQQHTGGVQYFASVLAYYGSEDAIISGQHIVWSENSRYLMSQNEYEYWGYYDQEYPDGYSFHESWYELWTPDGRYLYVQISPHLYGNDETRAYHEAEVIRRQLSDFRFAYEQLNNTEGLLFFISVETTERAINSGGIFQGLITAFGEENIKIYPVNEETLEERYEDTYERTNHFVFTNIGSNSENFNAFFKTQPVYFILYSSPGFTHTEQSGFADHTSYDHQETLFNNDKTEIYLAFSHEFVDSQNFIYSTARNEYIIDLSIIAASAVLVLGMTILLMIAAGRKYKVAAGETAPAARVHFTVLDKPYLDIGLGLLICWIAFLTYIVFSSASTVWHLGDITTMNIFLAVVVLLAVPPVLCWLMSLAKRLKAGRFWKHTLIYAIVYSCLYGSLRFLIRAAKSLWAGTRLTIRVVLISTAAFFTMFFVGFIGAETRELGVLLITILLLTSVIAVLLLMYARRIRNLEQGAKAASEGSYDTPIIAGGGELGSIAASINNITAGINTAVEERMKSERLKTELITNVSHDIRTPLTSIITYTDLLDHEGLDCERAPEYLDVLKQKSLRLKTLTEELFEAAKAATGNIDVNLADLNIVSLINQVVGELDNSIKSSGLDLRINLPEKLVARADGRLMQRVMENLFSNVFKYSMPNSRVYLDALETDASQIRIDIKNISSQELNFDPSELTERFKRGDESRADGGSGLGLSIVQSFMDAQGGRFYVSIDGDLFKATVFLPMPPVFLPVSPPSMTP